MKTTVIISIIVLSFFWGCESNNQHTSEQNEILIADSIESEIEIAPEIEEPAIEKPIKEIPLSTKKSFYPVFNIDTIMIFDHIEIGKNCYLFDFNKKSITQTKTKEHRVFQSEMFDKQVTLTELELDDTTKFQLAFIGDTAQVKWIKKKVIDDDTPQKKSILGNFNLTDYRRYFEDYGGPISLYSEQIKENPLVEMINYKDEKLFIVSYKLESYPDYIVNGPSFLISDSGNKIYPLTGPCSNKESNIFVLNGKLYIHTGSGCCDCGIVVEQLYEYDGSKIELAIKDGTWST